MIKGLLYAINFGDYDTIECLLNHGADANFSNQFGFVWINPLVNAGIKYQSEIVFLLIKYNADVNLVNKVKSPQKY